MNIKKIVKDIGDNARIAAQKLANISEDEKNRCLIGMAESIRNSRSKILAANAVDINHGKNLNLTPAMLDRLELNNNRLEAMAEGLEAVSKLKDPIGEVMASWTRPNGLEIARVRVPLGVIGVIYESRPNVTTDASGLCLKAGNCVILRGGSESYESCLAIYESIINGIEKTNIPQHAVQLIPIKSREAVGEMLKMSDKIDVIIPRGGKSLVERVRLDGKVPVFSHLEGICHTYVHETSTPEMATKIVVNAKMRRPGICGATETLLIDKSAAISHLPQIIDGLAAEGCMIRGDRPTQAIDSRVLPASKRDWDTEYLDSIISIKQVKDIDEAIEHINSHGTEHTDAIITQDNALAEKFIKEIHSAIVLHNTSTQFADGGEFGMGAEIGIATGKLHARGPVGVEQLTTFKYVVRGSGQIRP